MRDVIHEKEEQSYSIVGLYYLSGLITEDELKSYKDKLREVNISLVEIDRRKEIYNYIEELSSIIQFMLDGLVLTKIIDGVIPNAVYDALKYIIISTLNKVRKKFYTKHSAGGKAEVKPISIGIEVQMKTDNYKFKLDNLETDESAILALDNVLNFLREQQSEKHDHNEFIVNYDLREQIWIAKDVKIIINEIVETKRNESNSKKA